MQREQHHRPVTHRRGQADLVLAGRRRAQPAAQRRRAQPGELTGQERAGSRVRGQQPGRGPDPLGQPGAAWVIQRHLAQPRPQRIRAEQVHEVIQHRDPRIAGRGGQHREQVVQVARPGAPGRIGHRGPVEHAQHQVRVPGRPAAAQRLVAAPAGRAEHVQRRAGRRADRGQRSGQAGHLGQVDHEHRLAPPDRGVHEPEAGHGHLAGRPAGHQHAALRRAPGHLGRMPGRPLHAQYRAGSAHNPTFLNAPYGELPPRQCGESGARWRGRAVAAARSAQPPGQCGLSRRGQQGERRLPGQPAGQPGIGMDRVQQPVRVADRSGQVPQHLARASGEAGQRGPGADGQHPDQAGHGGHRQPRLAPPAGPADQAEPGGQQQGELGQQ